MKGHTLMEVVSCGGWAGAGGHALGVSTLATVRWACGWRGTQKGECKQEPV